MPSKKEQQVVIRAINQLGRRISAADVASKTGLPLISTSLIINQIAAETAGHLQVSPAGDIAYSFPIGYQARYITRGMARIFERFGQQAFAFAFFILRISFGVMLILSLAIVAIMFFVIIFTASKSKDNDEFNFDFDFFDWMILRELFFWNFNYSQPTYDRYNRLPAKAQQKNNFLYNCFSFLFGDGNPNADIEERRWQAIAQLIRKNQGTLTADQLSSYTGTSPDNEDAVLPVLVRFDGQPTVTESGNIIYLFPTLLATAVNETKTDSIAYLNERPWKFSQATADSMMWIIILAALNFFGSLWLYFQTLKFPAFSALLPLVSILVIYGSAFVVIPIGRYLFIQILNKRIGVRNKLRQDYASRLEHADEKLKTKLAEAKTMQLAKHPIKTDDLVYDTQKGILEQQISTIVTGMQ